MLRCPVEINFSSFFRKGTLLFNNTFALLAAFFMGLSYPASSFELLIVGRFLTGVNAGISSFENIKLVMVEQLCVIIIIFLININILHHLSKVWG